MINFLNLYFKQPITNLILIFLVFLSSFFTYIPLVSQTLDILNVYQYSSYYNAGIDYKIPSPTVEQVSNLRLEPHIDKIEPYIYSNLNFNFKNQIIISETLIVESDQLNGLLFNVNMIRTGEEESLIAAVDLFISRKYSVSIGDTLSVSIGNSKIEYKISHIFNPLPEFSNGYILLPISETISRAIFLDSSVRFSGAYISSLSSPETGNYLSQNYKPLGRLGDTYTQEMYDLFIKQDYSNEITVSSNQDEIYKSDLEDRIIGLRNSLLLSTFIILILILISIFLSKINNNNTSFVKLILNQKDNKSIFNIKVLNKILQILPTLFFASVISIVLYQPIVIFDGIYLQFISIFAIVPLTGLLILLFNKNNLLWESL